MRQIMLLNCFVVRSAIIVPCFALNLWLFWHIVANCMIFRGFIEIFANLCRLFVFGVLMIGFVDKNICVGTRSW